MEYKNEVRTQYSNIFDLKEKKIYLHHIGNFDQRVKFDLTEELAFKDVESEVNENIIADYFEPNRYQFEGMIIYIISKNFKKGDH